MGGGDSFFFTKLKPWEMQLKDGVQEWWYSSLRCFKMRQCDINGVSAHLVALGFLWRHWLDETNADQIPLQPRKQKLLGPPIIGQVGQVGQLLGHTSWRCHSGWLTQGPRNTKSRRFWLREAPPLMPVLSCCSSATPHSHHSQRCSQVCAVCWIVNGFALSGESVFL